ncbi:MAG TPA: urease accessory UreF family protein [Burkholderiaceae bacterium]|nr:urease accessory UreF family protein [Burkholderiaceae bacterium]
MKPIDPPRLGRDLRLKSLLAVLHLASPALPVGGFAYSQGMEMTIADGLVTDAATAQRWIEHLLVHVVARFEAPLWLRAFDAHATGARERLRALNAELLAARETAELRAETQQMGASLVRLFDAFGIAAPALAPVAYPLAFAIACSALGVDREAGLAAYLWSWSENQVLAAVKTLPLGQQSGQSMLLGLHTSIASAVHVATTLRDEELGTAAVGFAICSARHESLYSRLYRS